MIRLKRRNTAWLIAMGLLLGFALLAAPVSAPVQLSLIGAFAVAVIASMIELGPDSETLLDVLQRAPVRRRITPQAREAAERAASRAGFFNRSGIVMLDIGLIALQTGLEGLAMLAQDKARGTAEWIRDYFDTDECRALMAGDKIESL